MTSDSWLNELECLINEVHREKEELNLFDSFVEERKFETIARERDWIVQCYNTGETVTIFGRYMTLIERLMALRNPGNVINVRVIYETVSKYLGESYQIAISRKATDQENGDWRD
ncbi:hypothetical protein DPV78_010769 [Talaromyces pinophilus]|nr:hypothetical protein DPV78_010769 [Talaromyces pinophilus]